MKLALAKTASVAAALLLALAACSEDAGGSNDGTGDGGDGGEDPVFAAMKTWDACEVLDNLQPITEFMGIEGYGSTTAAGGEPVTREYDTTWYPDAIGCGRPHQPRRQLGCCWWRRACCIDHSRRERRRSGESLR